MREHRHSRLRPRTKGSRKPPAFPRRRRVPSGTLTLRLVHLALPRLVTRRLVIRRLVIRRQSPAQEPLLLVRGRSAARHHAALMPGQAAFRRPRRSHRATHSTLRHLHRRRPPQNDMSWTSQISSRCVPATLSTTT